MLYLTVIERCENNFSAYFPDVPGCVATGRTERDVLKNLSEALEFHLDGLREQGLPIPNPSSFPTFIAV